MHRRDADKVVSAAILAVLGTAVAAQEQEAPGFCQAGFVIADANDDGILEMAEAEALWGAEFAALDADASGGVSADEVAACTEAMGAEEMLPRNVSATGSGDLDGSGVQVELEGLADGSLARAEYMEAAMAAFDGAGNEEDNQLEWARAFIVLSADESESDIRSFGRDGYAARAAALFARLDTDADGTLTPEEWTGEAGDQGVTIQAGFEGLDADASGEVTLIEYNAAGTARFDRAREAALASGWDDGGAAAGIGEVNGGKVVATDSEGLAAEGEGAADAGTAEAATGAEAGTETGTDVDTGNDAMSGPGGVPVSTYRFGLGAD